MGPNSTGRRPDGVVLRHERTGLPELLRTFAEEAGHTFAEVHVPSTPELPNLTAYRLIILMGSAQAAYDDSLPWLAGEMAALRQAVDAGVPIIGVCFGAQLLARVLGGGARPAAAHEIGWHEVTSHDPSRVPAGPWFGWHHDEFCGPPGAKILASSPVCPQAFQAGRFLGVQFHLEMTPELLGRWLDDWARDELRRRRLSESALVEETARRARDRRLAARRLFNVWYQQHVAVGDGHPDGPSNSRPSPGITAQARTATKEPT